MAIEVGTSAATAIVNKGGSGDPAAMSLTQGFKTTCQAIGAPLATLVLYPLGALFGITGWRMVMPVACASMFAYLAIARGLPRSGPIVRVNDDGTIDFFNYGRTLVVPPGDSHSRTEAAVLGVLGRPRPRGVFLGLAERRMPMAGRQADLEFSGDTLERLRRIARGVAGVEDVNVVDMARTPDGSLGVVGIRFADGADAWDKQLIADAVADEVCRHMAFGRLLVGNRLVVADHASAARRAARLLRASAREAQARMAARAAGVLAAGSSISATRSWKRVGESVGVGNQLHALVLLSAVRHGLLEPGWKLPEATNGEGHLLVVTGVGVEPRTAARFRAYLATHLAGTGVSGVRVDPA
jgi:hypothetical protein